MNGKVKHTICKSFLLVLMVSINAIASAQWTRKADGLKLRSELGETIVYDSRLYSFVGFSDTLRNAEPTSEMYDPATNKWTYLASMPANTAMTHQDVVLIDNTIWHIGGRIGKNPGPISSHIWIYNITTNNWSKGPELVDPATGKTLVLAASSSVLLGRTLHIFGGFTPTSCNNDQETYHLTLDVDTWFANPALPAQWKNNLKPLPLKRNHLSGLSFAGKIYAIGGQLGHDCGGGKEVPYCHMYNPMTDTWTQLTSLPTGRSHAEGGIFAIDGMIYLVGGQGDDGKSTKKVTIFDPSKNGGAGSWTENTSLALPTIYEGMSAKVIGTTFILSHGSSGSSKYPLKKTYTRTITRKPVYKLGFPSECLMLNDSSGSIVKAKTLVFTIDGTKQYNISSNASWLTITKNFNGITNQNSADVEVTANSDGLAPGTYSTVITATGVAGGISYEAATECVSLVVNDKGVQTKFNLNITLNGTGTVAKSPDQPGYTANTTVSLTATPGTGYMFNGWKGDVISSENPLTVLIDGDKNIEATFTALPAQFAVTVSANGNGSISKSPDQTKYDEGTDVILTATPSDGETFTGWSGDTTGNTNPLTIVANAEKNIVANFTAINQKYFLNVSNTAGGTSSKTPDNINYSNGSIVTLQATPAAGYQFSGWSGSISTSTNPVNVTMDGDKNITVNFTPLPLLVSNIVTTTSRTYNLSKLYVGNTVYTDRTYQATSVPAFLDNAPLIRTANDDKYVKSATALSFNVSQPVTVYVCYDPRATKLPGWMNTWQKNTGVQIGVNDSKISYMLVYSKAFSAGTISLGGNLADPAAGALNNYFVALLPQNTQSVQQRSMVNNQSNFESNPFKASSSFKESDFRDVKIYPNPNNGNDIIITSAGFKKHEVVTVKILDGVGKVIDESLVKAKDDGSLSKRISASKLYYKGLYFINLVSTTKSIKGKLVVN